MKSNIPASFNIVKSPPKQLRELTPTIELNCEWLSDPAMWNKEKFTSDIVKFIEQSHGVNAYPNMVLIGMLAHQIDLYVQCSHKMTQTGLVEAYNKGVTSGPSLYFSMADKALNRVIQLMKELGLTPSHRIGTVRQTSAEALEFEAFMAGP
jgi:phage terminase small subunit